MEIKEKFKTKLLATEMDFLRRSSRISKLEKIRNLKIREKMNKVNTILETIQYKQLQWFGHVKRMKDNRIPKIILEWFPAGRKKRGRPKHSRLREITGILKDKNLTDKDYEDRDKWRNKIKIM